MKDNIEIDKAIVAHAQWKQRLRIAIDTGKSEWNTSDVKSHDKCSFGKWLETLPTDVKREEISRKVQALHTQFHVIASNVLSLATTGHKAEAETAIGFGSDYANTSAKLTQALMEWKRM